MEHGTKNELETLVLRENGLEFTQVVFCNNKYPLSIGDHLDKNGSIIPYIPPFHPFRSFTEEAVRSADVFDGNTPFRRISRHKIRMGNAVVDDIFSQMRPGDLRNRTMIQTI